MNQYTYRVFLISEEDRGTLRSRMEGEADFANPVSVGQNIEVTLGAKMPYELRGVVARMDHKGLARDVPRTENSKTYSSLFLQTDLSSEKLNSYHERNGPHY